MEQYESKTSHGRNSSLNRVNLAESLPLVLKKEYGCHRRDILKTEQCLARQLESSMSSGQIIMELNDLENSNSLSKRLENLHSISLEEKPMF